MIIFARNASSVSNAQTLYCLEWRLLGSVWLDVSPDRRLHLVIKQEQEILPWRCWEWVCTRWCGDVFCKEMFMSPASALSQMQPCTSSGQRSLLFLLGFSFTWWALPSMITGNKFLWRKRNKTPQDVLLRESNPFPCGKSDSGFIAPPGCWLFSYNSITRSVLSPHYWTFFLHMAQLLS